MAAILAGKFAYDSYENLMEFFMGLGVPEGVVENLLPKAGTIREIAVEGNIRVIMASGPNSTTLILDQEVEEKIDQSVFKSTAKLEGNILRVRSVGDHFVLNRHYEFTEKGINETVTSDKTDIVAKVFLKRV